MQSSALGSLAKEALLYEVSVTPKPGLVDRAGSGAHMDMDYGTFTASAEALEPYFAACAAAGSAFEGADPAQLFPQLRELGKQAEAAMYRATGGVNTHKGAVFTLGLLCAAAGLLAKEAPGRNAEAPRPVSGEDICLLAGNICRDVAADYTFSDKCPSTAGEKLHAAEGVGGIRAEAANGFPALRELALPLLRNDPERDSDPNLTGVRILLQLICRVEDTTLMKRSGLRDLTPLHLEAEAVLTSPDLLSAAAALDRSWSARGLSAGGCADLLSAAYFLYSAEKSFFSR